MEIHYKNFLPRFWSREIFHYFARKSSQFAAKLSYTEVFFNHEILKIFIRSYKIIIFTEIKRKVLKESKSHVRKHNLFDLVHIFDVIANNLQ